MLEVLLVCGEGVTSVAVATSGVVEDKLKIPAANSNEDFFIMVIPYYNNIS
ncbi:hypothetical protein RU85_GL001652 [Lactococcus garvieae]|nr:hypothetical protein RU85_GL001652 [Lactococcus garvieae]